MVFWYSSQQMRIRLGGFVTKSFTVTNGGKEGEILSPGLFNLYMDKLVWVLRLLEKPRITLGIFRLFVPINYVY